MIRSIFDNKALAFFIYIMIFSQAAFSESFTIENVGLSQIESTNQEFTLSRTVVLSINITDNATRCRYANEDLNYYIWESCTTLKYWLLTSGIGDKTVHMQINHTNGIITYYNDSIYYDYSGSGLDTTPPGNVLIYAKEYSNDNSSVAASWSESIDNESQVLDIDIVYQYLVRLNGVDNNSWTSVPKREMEYDINTTDGDNVTISIKSINSAGLESISNHSIIIDQTPPSVPSINVSVNQTSWYNIQSVIISWNASDDNQLKGYSYLLSQDNTTLPDAIPEGNKDDLLAHTSKTFSTRIDGVYHFRIRSVDTASNPSDIRYYSFKIDNSAPKKPIIEQAIQYVSAGHINMSWSQTPDISGIQRYEVQISNSSEFTYIVNSTNTTSRTATLGLADQGTYYSRVRSTNTAGLTSIWSNEEESDFDNNPPVITLISPADNSASIAKDNPRVIVRTDEIATCYNQDDNKEFKYTESTYHETRIGVGSNLNIICYDLNNNSDVLSVGIGSVIPTDYLTFLGPFSSTQYTSTLARINISTDSMYGYEAMNLNASLNGSEISFNLQPTQSPTNYMFSFQAPEKEGEYTLILNGESVALTVQDVKATISYIDSGLSLEDKSRKTAYGKTSNQMIGIIDESNDGNQVYSTNNNLTLVSETSTKKILFYTRKISNLKQKESELESRQFFNKDYSSINAYAAKPSKKKIIIENPDILINTTKDFGNGLLNLKIALTSIEDGKKHITIEENRNKDKDQKIYS